MKTISYQGRDIEITKVFFTFADETAVQEGILVHDSADEFSDADAIYGNGWTIGSVNDADDLESLFTSGDGTTYFQRRDDGTYHLEA